MALLVPDNTSLKANQWGSCEVTVLPRGVKISLLLFSATVRAFTDTLFPLSDYEHTDERNRYPILFHLNKQASSPKIGLTELNNELLFLGLVLFVTLLVTI